MSTPVQEEAVAVAAFWERKANPPEEINNADLFAGSPMYFYCRYCGHLSDVLPEDYDPRYQRPTHVCDGCRVLLDKGWLPKDWMKSEAVSTP